MTFLCLAATLEYGSHSRGKIVFEGALFNPCIVIPVYQHQHTISAVVAGLRVLEVPCILVDDGSAPACAALLDQLTQAAPQYLTLLRHSCNQGKGAAVLTGCRYASLHGYTHMLQIDADGQLDSIDAAYFLRRAEQQPGKLIMAYPIYDAALSKRRLYSRYASHIWLSIYTLSLQIKDPMCGLRVYPVAAVMALAARTKLGLGIDFDTDILVRLYWDGVEIINLPTALAYPLNGVSHFRLWRDNLLITPMHTMLFFGMLWRAPQLLARTWRRRQRWCRPSLALLRALSASQQRCWRAWRWRRRIRCRLLNAAQCCMLSIYSFLEMPCMRPSSQFSLLSQRRFGPFFWTQFFGALNDNLFKTALMVVLTYDALRWSRLDASTLSNLIPGLFILPYVLFSATAGQLADKFDKAALARCVKWLELGIMALAGVGWLSHTLWLLIAAIVGMGMHSTLFGPVKYAYLPQQLQADELIGGNGLIEMGTFVGILLGEISGALLVAQTPWGIYLVAGVTLLVALIGLRASYLVPATPAPAPTLRINWNLWTESLRNLRFSRQNRVVFLSMLGNSWFWFYGALILAQFPVYAKAYLHGDHYVFVLLLTIFSLGIGAGSLLCERLSGHKVEIGLVPFGSIGLSLFGIDLFFASLAYTNATPVTWLAFLTQAGALRILFDIAMIGVFGGFFIVPLFALIQTRCARQHLARTIAGMNILNALFMVGAAGVAMLLLGQGWTIPHLFLFTALCNAIVAVYIFSLAPEFLLRFLAWLLVHTLHRVTTIDAERIPAEGAAILVCNHVSYIDALVILAASPRPIRFVMDHHIFHLPLLGWIFKTSKAIPIATAKDDPALMAQAFDAISLALKQGDVVCIFPEGKLTTTGELGPFKRGIGTIMARSQAPVIPMALRGLWGHVLSRRAGNLFQRSYHARFRSRLTLAVGLPVAPDQATPELLQQQVHALRGTWK